MSSSDPHCTLLHCRGQFPYYLHQTLVVHYCIAEVIVSMLSSPDPCCTLLHCRGHSFHVVFAIPSLYIITLAVANYRVQSSSDYLLHYYIVWWQVDRFTVSMSIFITPSQNTITSYKVINVHVQKS